jgi:hypothetical protein
MTNDPHLDVLGGLPMPQSPPSWSPLDLNELTDPFDGDVRVVDIDETYVPPPPPEPEPIGALRHRQTWAERHRQDVDDLRLDLGQAQMSLRDAADGCKAVHYHEEVAGEVGAALDRVIEALRLIDLFDPE